MIGTAKTTGFALLLFLVALAGAELLFRGPLRVTSAVDMASPYVSALRFIHSENPYPSDDFLAQWHRAGAPDNWSVDNSGQHPIYPPTALLVVAPLAELPWTWAVRCYVWACTFGYLGMVWLFSRLVGDNWRSLRRLGFIAFALGVSPVYAGIDKGNLSIMVFILCGYAMYLAFFRDGPACGVLLALGFCVKPTSALAAVLIVLLYRRIESFLAFLGVSALIAGCTAIVISHVSPLWKADYQSNLRFLFGPNGAATFATQNPARFDLVNLQVPFYSLLNNVRSANFLAWSVSALLAIFWLILFSRGRSIKPASYWLGVGSLSLLALLPVYQRNYNAGVILFVAVWAFENIHETLARAALLVSGMFLIPGEAILRKSGLAERFSGSTLWNSLVMPQLTWAIVAVVVLCLLYKGKRDICVPDRPGDPLYPSFRLALSQRIPR
jgi:hypothetical protein